MEVVVVVVAATTRSAIAACCFKAAAAAPAPGLALILQKPASGTHLAPQYASVTPL